MPALVKIGEGAIPPSILFAENQGLLFEIRPPQRRFKWTNKQVNDLWEDIITAHNHGRDVYFLGALLLVSLENGRVSVIDGQQRLTTLSILLAVLRDQCKAFPGLVTRSDGIQRLISRVDNDGNPVGSLVVTLQKEDNQTYVELVKQAGSTDLVSSTTQKNLLLQAAKRLKEHVTNHINVPDKEDKLRQLCEYIQSNVKFLPLEVRSEGEGHLVFDTTNTRGLGLSPSESLKARLATVAREDMEVSDNLISTWNAAAEKLENAGLAINAMDDYLHAIWCSKVGYTPKRTLDRIATRLNNTKGLKSFVEDLAAYCDSYLSVVAPTGNSWLTEDLKDLRRLNVQSYGFLTMVKKHASEKFEEAVSLVLSLQIRNVTLGAYQANEYEKSWPNWSVMVRDGKAPQAFSEIRGHMVADEAFQRAVEDASVYASATARHLLRRLDPISQPGSGVLPVQVDVEHVFPKGVVNKLIGKRKLTKNSEWWIEHLGFDLPKTESEKEELGKKLQPWLFRLGNQALLNDKANRGAQDNSFDKKKVYYQKQALELTKTLDLSEEWTFTQIEAKQKEMAKRAVTIWPK